MGRYETRQARAARGPSGRRGSERTKRVPASEASNERAGGRLPGGEQRLLLQRALLVELPTEHVLLPSAAAPGVGAELGSCSGAATQTWSPSRRAARLSGRHLSSTRTHQWSRWSGSWDGASGGRRAVRRDEQQPARARGERLEQPADRLGLGAAAAARPWRWRAVSVRVGRGRAHAPGEGTASDYEGGEGEETQMLSCAGLGSDASAPPLPRYGAEPTFREDEDGVCVGERASQRARREGRERADLAGRDATEMRPRCGRDISEIQPRPLSERQPRDSRDKADLDAECGRRAALRLRAQSRHLPPLAGGGERVAEGRTELGLGA